MQDRPRVHLLADPDDEEATRLGLLGGADVVHDGFALVRARPQVVHVRRPMSGLATAALACTIARAVAVVVTPLGPAAALPWWERRFHRFVLPSQADARAWCAAGIALGRIVVVSPGDPEAERIALHAAWREVYAMGTRAG